MHLSINGYILGGLVITHLGLLLTSIFQIYDYACSFDQEVMYSFSLTSYIDYNHLFKVDFLASVTLVHCERPLCRHTIRAFSALHRASV
jgi:hypothetical protein